METVIDYPKDLTFEKVWASLQESNQRFYEQLNEQRKESDRQKKEFDQQMKELRIYQMETTKQLRETEKIVKENGRQIGGLHNSFGNLAEHLVAPGIAKIFNELGFHFDTIAPGGLKIQNSTGDKILAEIDLILENGENIIAIEIKSRVKTDDIEHHIRRLEILKENREKKNEKQKKIMGAIAGAIFGSVEKKAAHEAGFFVLEQSGDTMKLVIPQNFVPREW